MRLPFLFFTFLAARCIIIETMKREMRCVIFLSYLFCATTHAAAEGGVKDLRDFQYWENGNVRQAAVYDSVSGKLKAKAFCRTDGSVEKVEKYDSSGNKFEEAFYDDKGRLKAGIDGWAAMRWFYENFQLMSQATYDEDGRLIERKIYSPSGKLIFRQYRDSDDRPHENAAMYMLLGGQNVSSYDTRGSLEEARGMMGEK